MGVFFGYFWYFFLAVTVFLGIRDRTLRKYKPDLSAPYAFSGTIYRKSTNTTIEGTIWFYPDKTIVLSNVGLNGEQTNEQLLGVQKISFKLTASLATSYLYLRQKEDEYVVFNRVDRQMLEQKLVSVERGALLHSGAEVTGVSINSLTSSDEHTNLHVWLKKNRFPGYSAQLIQSDWVGYVIIMLLPTMIALGMSLEMLSKNLFDESETGSAFMGVLSIIIMTATPIYRIIASVKLRKLIQRAQSAQKSI